jgi:murein DD-endopeptidase MepM/ murein hydrolase activator NlpD
MWNGKWRIVLAYFLFSIVLFGASAWLFGIKDSSGDNFPEGTQAIGQDISGENWESGLTDSGTPEQSAAYPWSSEADRMRSEMAIVGIKSADSPAMATSNGIEAKSPKSLKDFPSPVQATPLRKAGNYYSEALQAYLFHAGTDYAQAEGAVIRVKHAGTVIYAGPDALLGQKVEIDCGEDWSVVYGGLENLRVQEGDSVQYNDAIGQVGYYPNAEGVKGQPHLHFEVWHGDAVQLPAD